jgi:UPF0716 protein FxsA
VPVFLILFIVIPLLELALLIRVGQSIGVLSTLGLVILSAVIGVILLQQQGYATLASARRKMAQGLMPAEEMLGGMFLAVGGVLFLIPGFITDVLGLCCLIPGIRRLLLARLLRRVYVAPVAGRSTSNRGEHVIEGEFERERRRDPEN